MKSRSFSIDFIYFILLFIYAYIVWAIDFKCNKFLAMMSNNNKKNQREATDKEYLLSRVIL
jgi:hypothetical protein